MPEQLTDAEIRAIQALLKCKYYEKEITNITIASEAERTSKMAEINGVTTQEQLDTINAELVQIQSDYDTNVAADVSAIETATQEFNAEKINIVQ